MCFGGMFVGRQTGLFIPLKCDIPDLLHQYFCFCDIILQTLVLLNSVSLRRTVHNGAFDCFWTFEGEASSNWIVTGH